MIHFLVSGDSEIISYVHINIRLNTLKKKKNKSRLPKIDLN